MNVSLGCYDITSHRRMSGLSSTYFSQFWHWESQDQGGGRPGSWWEHSSCLQRAFALSSHGRERPLVSLIARTLIPPSWLNYILIAPSPNTIMLGIRVSTYEFWGNTNSLWQVFYLIVDAKCPKTYTQTFFFQMQNMFNMWKECFDWT